jgi:hypothetical protein
MSLAFPASPTVGQNYQQWTWDGAKWVPNPGAVPGLVTSVNGASGAVSLLGSRVQISRTEISAAVTSVDLFAGFDGSYEEQEHVLFDWSPTGADAALQARCSTDGSTFDSGASNYGYAWGRFGTDNSGSGAGAFGSAVQLGPAQNNSVNFPLLATVSWKIGGPGLRASCTYVMQAQNGTVLLGSYGSGGYAVNAVIKGIRYYFNGFPNITRGTLIQYGIKK